MEEVIASTYRIIKKLGSGGGGNVYLADHLRLNKKVVLKADKRRVTTKTGSASPRGRCSEKPESSEYSEGI